MHSRKVASAAGVRRKLGDRLEKRVKRAEKRRPAPETARMPIYVIKQGKNEEKDSNETKISGNPQKSAHQ
ncbi:hypothetical protein AUJ14_04545 [Candidatus Micrarchaeota archaeon CG1_02_55_22]|nr:MAG: hypothetical protein AUJ14_04545 [Candidatus Micrarchaeota archaeon CG1_02_55_22]